MSARLFAGLSAMALTALSLGPGAGAQGRNKDLGVLFDRYERGEFGAAVAGAAQDEQDLRAVIAQLTGRVPVLNPDTPESQMRRLALAAFSLEIVMATRSSLFNDAGSKGSGKILLEWACSLLRRSQTPLPAERLWHLAAFGVIEGAADAQALTIHVAHANKRFPDEPRMILTKAIALELETWPDDRQEGRYQGLSEPPQLVPAFRAAANRPEVRDEALLRLGFFELRRGSPRSALARFDEMRTTADPFIDYLRHLFRGRALEKTNRLPDAIGEYRLATVVLPSAQTARIALAGALSANRERPEAAALLDDVLAAPGDVLSDPWFVYGAADQRFYPELMTQLRREVRK
ncbi:MAG TPA: hypothetical protein VFV78_09985 [Vicinamibacterales bacterium]|nr:hypothetical protein [Vicinamibacterales bacterium]